MTREISKVSRAAAGGGGTRWVAFFRGINVGGRNKLPMKDLAREFLSLGYHNVQTYIQSGNVVFTASEKSPANLSSAITTLIAKRYGFAPWVLVLGLDALEQAVCANPFPDAKSEPKTLHLFFVARKPAHLDRTVLDALKAPNESYALIGKVLYLHAPSGIGRSKLAARVERMLGVEVTARNWRTVLRVLEMARESG